MIIFGQLKKLNISKKIIFILNVNLLIINIVFVDKEYKIENRIIFKAVDFFNLNLYKKSFNEISSYLSNKFKKNINENLRKKASNKKIIRVTYAGLFNKVLFSNWLKSKLDDEFLLMFDEPNPDYLLYNCFNDDDSHLNHNNPIRIAIYTENIMPDINYADYAIGQYHINYLDRYFKYSILFMRYFSDLDQKRYDFLNNPIRKKFCGAVISNCDAKFRLNFIDRLNKYKHVDIRGKCNNITNIRIENKIEFLSSYKFSLAMENSKGDGYISEKIFDSFRAGTIPIYYGDYLIDEFINPKTYILIKGVNDIDKKIEYIKKIDQDDKLYISIMKEKPIIDKYFLDKIDNKELKDFFKNIFNQDKNMAFRRDNNYYDFNCNHI